MAYSDGIKAILGPAKTTYKNGANIGTQLLVNAVGKNYNALTPKAKKALNLMAKSIYDGIVAGGGPG